MLHPKYPFIGCIIKKNVFSQVYKYKCLPFIDHKHIYKNWIHGVQKQWCKINVAWSVVLKNLLHYTDIIYCHVKCVEKFCEILGKKFSWSVLTRFTAFFKDEGSVNIYIYSGEWRYILAGHTKPTGGCMWLGCCHWDRTDVG